jgi:uncharacterized protein YhjY with autotransporter beta-barrel domain
VVNNHFGSSLPASIHVEVTAKGSASAAGGTTTVTTRPETPVTVKLGDVARGSFTSAAVIGMSPVNGGASSLVGSSPFALTFTPAAGFHGIAHISTQLTTAVGQMVAVDVLVLVSEQPDPSKDPGVLGLINAQAATAQRFARSQIDNVNRRLESLHDGRGGVFTNDITVTMDGQSMRGPETARALLNGMGDPRGVVGGNGNGGFERSGMGSAGGFGFAPNLGSSMANADAEGQADAGATQGQPSSPSRIGIWAAGMLDIGANGLNHGSASYDHDTVAVSVGVDGQLGRRGLLGISVGYNHNTSEIANDGTRSAAHGTSGAVYGSYQPSAHTYLDAVFGGGGLSFNSRRYSSDVKAYLLGRRDGEQRFGSLTAGYSYTHSSLQISPYGRLEASHSTLDGFIENGDAASALSYGQQTVRSLRTVLGVRASDQVALSYGMLTPRARIELGHEFNGSSNTTVGYAFIPSINTFNVVSSPYGGSGNTLQLGLGSDLLLQRSGVTLTFDYNYLLQQNAHSQMIRLGVTKQF